MALATREFSFVDQGRFASTSGDHNPMHVDALYARRTQAGAPVVHGIHLLLWALDAFAVSQPELPPLRALRAQFSKFVYVEEQAEVSLTGHEKLRARLNISVNGSSCAKVTIDFGEEQKDPAGWPIASPEIIPHSRRALSWDFDEFSGRAGRLHFAMTERDAVAMFPAASKWIGLRRLSAIAATSHLVGMVCPGLHSIYSELRIGTYGCPDRENCLDFRVVETDSRFRSVQLEVMGGGVRGTIESAARMPPVEQATMESMKGLLTPGEFADSLTLVVGGSRGLGELTAKMIAAGGGRVIVTWHSGKDDAERVAREIRSGGGRCDVLQYDACKPADEQLAQLVDTPTHAFYFATPLIFRSQAQVFSLDRFRNFTAVYVEGFWSLWMALRARNNRVSVLYPSSVFVTERPRGMTEYSMAKAAGEVLCQELNASDQHSRVVVSRLPRLLTDQTASTTAEAPVSGVETMLPVIREVQSWPGT